MHRGNRVLWGLIAATVAVQLLLLYRFSGFLTGDDVEVLAAAFRVAVGFDYRPWDIRNLFVPDVVVAPVVLIATKVGVGDPLWLIELATLPFIAANAATVWIVHRLAMRWSGDGTTANLAAALFAFHWIPLSFGGSVYPRTLATLSIAAAALLVDRSGSLSAHGWAGMLIGLAFADRFSELVFFAPLLLVVAFHPFEPDTSLLSRKARVAALCAGAVVSISLLAGAYDWWSWGSPFASVRKFADLTLIHPDFASKTKYQPAGWYLTNIAKWLAPTMLPLFWFGRRTRAVRAAALFVVVPLIAFSVVRHKELRYLQALTPFVAIAAAAGFAQMWRSGYRRSAAVLVGLTLIWNAAGVRMVAKKSMPSVSAARSLAADPSVHTVAMSQLWACGDRLYLGDRRAVIDMATPPRDLANGIRFANAMIVYESDLADRSVTDAIHAGGFVATQTFRDGPARAVVVFRKR